ncbi:MAG: ComF family protein [Oscillospiraceae bacterium]|nr:ComF family protein [Oscillospiraceae bacterium]
MINELKIHEMKRRAVSIIFPNVCPFCGRVVNAREYYCPSCVEMLPKICRELSPPENVSRLFACCWYSGIAREAVHRLKFGCIIDPADAFSLMMSETLADHAKDFDAIVPVPSGIKSIEKRGFSPAKVIARRISMRLELPIERALKAGADKIEQKTLSRKKRLQNARESFFVKNNAEIAGKRLLLVDDVTTTGSTLSVLAELLLKAGAADVSAAVFAKVPGEFKKLDEPKRFKKLTKK